MDPSLVATKILTEGKFYHPASAHYGNPAISVTCDRCRKTAIPACVGWDKYDFCMACVEAVSARPAFPSLFPTPDPAIAGTPVAAMEPRMYRPTTSAAPQSYMEANMYGTGSLLERMFGSGGRPQTRMEHDMYLTGRRPTGELQTQMEQNLFRRGGEPPSGLR